MLTFIKEQLSLWDYLKEVRKPIVLYGTGDGADKILDRLQEEEISVEDIYVSDEFARGQTFRGYTVKPFSLLLRTEKPLIVLIAFASERPELLERFYALNELQETYAPHVPLFMPGEGVSMSWLQKYSDQLMEVYGRLADERSRRVFASVLNYKLSGKLRYLQECTSGRREDLNELFRFTGAQTYVDLGAYDGDTVEEFLALTAGRFSHIYAVEPDPKNFARLQKRMRVVSERADRWGGSVRVGGDMGNRGESRIHCICAGIWSDPGKKTLFGDGGRQSTLVSPREMNREPGADGRRRNKKKREQEVLLDSVDHILQQEPAGYIKYDVEGVEEEALLGSRKHLIKNSCGTLPKLLIAAYHHDEDIFKLPLLVWKLQPEYTLYLRKHPYVPAWEINLFAI